MLEELGNLLSVPAQLALRFRRNDKLMREKTFAHIRIQLKAHMHACFLQCSGPVVCYGQVEHARFVPVSQGKAGGLERLSKERALRHTLATGADLGCIHQDHEALALSAVAAMADSRHDVASRGLRQLMSVMEPKTSGFFSLLLSQTLTKTDGTDAQYWLDRAHNLEFAEVGGHLW